MLFEAGKNEIESDEEHDLSSRVHSKVMMPEIECMRGNVEDILNPKPYTLNQP